MQQFTYQPSKNAQVAHMGLFADIDSPPSRYHDNISKQVLGLRQKRFPVSERPSRKLVVILHADVVGSTALVQRDEALAHERIQNCFLRLSNTIEVYAGNARELRGDAVVAEFKRASDALTAAIVFQAENKAFVDALEDDIQPRLRIGIAMGEVVIADNTMTGEGVVLAQRLEQLAEPGSIYIQGAAYETVPKHLPFEYEYMGEQVLKGFDESVRAYTATLKSGASASPPEFVALPDEPALMQAEKPSIAVLPFRSLGRDSEQDYLADGIRLAIQASLVKVSGLFLIGPAAVNDYRDEVIAAHEVAHDLGVRYILEGAVQQSQGRIRITVQLTDGVNRRMVWAERYDRELADTLAVQDEITSEVIKALDVTLVSGEQTQALRSTVKNLDALHAFYRGLNHFYARTKDDNVAALRLFEDVVRLQPDSPVGASYMCMTHWIDALMGWSESKDRSLKVAAEWAEKAVALDDSSGLAYVVLASAHLLNHRHDEALATCYEAVKLRTSCPAANSYLATVLHYCGHSAEAVAQLKEAIRITPVYPPWFLTLLAAAYRESGELGHSISTAQEAVRRSPDDLDARVVLCTDYSLSGRKERAEKLAREILAINPVFSAAAYVENEPYKDRETVSRLTESLLAAGLPH